MVLLSLLLALCAAGVFGAAVAVRRHVALRAWEDELASAFARDRDAPVLLGRSPLAAPGTR